jgi:hypothetical protein
MHGCPLAFASLAWLAGFASAATLDCPAARTLDDLAECLDRQVLPSGSGKYVPPSAAEMADYRGVVRRMLRGRCAFSLPRRLRGILDLRTFPDASNGRRYCVLVETQDANADGLPDRGWGTFIVYRDAAREISHQAPHPLFDGATDLEAMAIFRDTDSRSFAMAGAHRNANSGPACVSGENVADVVHDTRNMFHAANEALKAFYGRKAWTALQWHGNATCGHLNAYISVGLASAPALPSRARTLRDRMRAQHPEWTIENPPDGGCPLNALTNVQGRLLNGVSSASVCTTDASAPRGRFIHVEQNSSSRLAPDWIDAVRETWPPATPRPSPR